METKFYSHSNVEFTIGGKTFANLESFIKSIKLKKSGKCSYIYVRKDGFFNITGYAVEHCEPLPCFDSSDYIYEDRSRSDFFFVDDYENAKELYKSFESKASITYGTKYERLSFVRNDSADKTFITVTK
jgi:hypothetical protein